MSNQPSDEQRYNTFDRCKWDGHVLFIQMRGFMPKTPGFLSRCYMCPHATKSSLDQLSAFFSLDVQSGVVLQWPSFRVKKLKQKEGLCNGIRKMRGQWVWIRLRIGQRSVLLTFCLMTAKGTACSIIKSGFCVCAMQLQNLSISSLTSNILPCTSCTILLLSSFSMSFRSLSPLGGESISFTAPAIMDYMICQILDLKPAALSRFADRRLWDKYQGLFCYAPKEMVCVGLSSHIHTHRT